MHIYIERDPQDISNLEKFSKFTFHQSSYSSFGPLNGESLRRLSKELAGSDIFFDAPDELK